MADLHRNPARLVGATAEEAIERVNSWVMRDDYELEGRLPLEPEHVRSPDYITTLADAVAWETTQARRTACRAIRDYVSMRWPDDIRTAATLDRIDFVMETFYACGLTGTGACDSVRALPMRCDTWR